MSVALSILCARLRRRCGLTPGDVAPLEQLGHDEAAIGAGMHIHRERATPAMVPLLESGIAISYKLARDGMRQIVAIHVPGDWLGFESVLLGATDCGVQTLTDCRLSRYDRRACRTMIRDHPGLAIALWADSMVAASALKEQILNVGRRSARDRMAHFLCELGYRLDHAGMGSAQEFDLPMSQEQLADVLGITPVHVGRILNLLEAEKLVERSVRHIRIVDPARLSTIAGFRTDYLHPIPDTDAPFVPAIELVA